MYVVVQRLHWWSIFHNPFWMTVRIKTHVRGVIIRPSFATGVRTFPLPLLLGELVTPNYPSMGVKLVMHARATTVLIEKLAPLVIWEDVNGAPHQASVSRRIRGHARFPRTVSLTKNAKEQSQSSLASKIPYQNGCGT